MVLTNTNATMINGEDIKTLHDDIVDKNSVHTTSIRGKKIFFGGLQTDKLSVSMLEREWINGKFYMLCFI